MSASNSPVCLQVMDDYESEDNREVMAHVMNLPVKAKRYFIRALVFVALE